MLDRDPVRGQWRLIEPRLGLQIGESLESLAAVARVIYAIPVHWHRKPAGWRKAAHHHG
jgi:hypothetical protein